MKKVIVKCRLLDKEKFEDKLSDIDLDFKPIFWQHDRIYVPRGYKKGINLPRLIMRTEMHAVDEPPIYKLIMKRHIEDSGVDIVEETPITDYTNTVNIILQLGFKPAGEVSRRRQSLEMSEGVILYLDTLDGKNESYAKIESIVSDSDSIAEAKTDLKKTLETLDERDVVESAYFEI